MAFTKAERYVVLQLVNAVTNGITQSERVALRADLLDVLGVDEAKVAELVSEDARSQHTEAKADAPANGEQEAGTEDAPAPADG